MESRLEQLLNRFESLVNRLEGATAVGATVTTSASASSSAPASTGVPRIVKDFDNELNHKIKALEDAATALGGDVIASIVS